MWRLVTDRIATLEEIERFWSLDDVLRANSVADAKAAAEHDLYESLKGKS